MMNSKGKSAKVVPVATESSTYTTKHTQPPRLARRPTLSQARPHCLRLFLVVLALCGFLCFALLRGFVWLEWIRNATIASQRDSAITPVPKRLLEQDEGFYNGYLGRHIVGKDLSFRFANNENRAQVANTASTTRYLIGVGKADITGPIVEINMMGYADSNQVGSGLRQRLYSRAFIVGDLQNPADRFIYLVLDTQSGDTAIRYGILSGLKRMGPEYSMYNQNNLAVSGTHSHSGPGAWLNYLLPQITSKGFDKQSYQAIVDGCILSIVRAHESLSPGYLTAGSTKLHGASINRSLFAYLANRAEERARYNISVKDDGSVDKVLTMLKFQRTSDNKNIGVLTWFATHGTSMNVNNTLITGDNKGVAADLFEKNVRGGKFESDDFVAGFSQANMGDSSPNIHGAWCEDGSGERCDLKKSTCRDGNTRHCHARGPEFQKRDDHDGAASCFEIGRRQYQGALSLYESLLHQAANIGGSGVKSVHKFHDMAGFKFMLSNGSLVKTCPAALGYSFAAGTWDEPGVHGITQHGSNSSNSPFIWNFVSWLLRVPNQAQVECHYPKPILLDVGGVSQPYDWTPNIVDIQTFRVGQFFIIASPGEATTMAGRRWKEAVAKGSISTLRKELGGEAPIVVLGGPSNSYTHYITTEEEYGAQRYEGASTLYGAHTLAAYINQSVELLPFLQDEARPERFEREGDRQPPDNSEQSLSFINGVLYDSAPRSRRFGDVILDRAQDLFSKGETVIVRFVGANPRNNLRLERTFAAVEHRETPGDSWALARDDSDWNLIFRWHRTSRIMGHSEVEVEWTIENWAQPGEYRLRYFGDSKSWKGEVHPFEGASKEFSVK